MPHISTPMIYTSQVISMDHPLQSWLEMGLQGYALIFTLEMNGQEIVLLIQNPSHLAEIVTEGMRLGMGAYTQNQWFTTQTPLVLENQASTSTQHWSYPMNPANLHGNPVINLMPFYPPHHIGQVFAPWFQSIYSFNPLSPYASPLSPMDNFSLQETPP